ncbi:PREDICTED: ribosomal RNA small subunit methyltransferase nep-1-like [Theobroma cacao]|uniref:Ribosomal RNA small subunit methyltransferase nep-1-like n=1 Tax=Theobroma cacao TaxID=3641 RepID=A0AB32WQA0_THECC|nr:PREDICTED: ribosomal RNA small subunit methyltransferase nep-1-like [Theobroma cacao]
MGKRDIVHISKDELEKVRDIGFVKWFKECVNDVPLEPPFLLGASTEEVDNVTSTDNSQGSTSIDSGASGDGTSSRSRRKLLNSDEDDNFLRKQGKNLGDYRPDIVLEVLKELFDSPLNDNNRVRAIYVKTDDGLLFQVEPHVRIPRTHDRFYGIMLELLEIKRVRVPETNEVIIQQLDEPLTQYLSSNSRIVGSYTCYGSEMYNVFAAEQGKPWFVVAVSNYPMSAAYSTKLVCIALANKWELH